MFRTLFPAGEEMRCFFLSLLCSFQSLIFSLLGRLCVDHVGNAVICSNHHQLEIEQEGNLEILDIGEDTLGQMDYIVPDDVTEEEIGALPTVAKQEDVDPVFQSNSPQADDCGAFLWNEC